jgi:hypothetical protein
VYPSGDWGWSNPITGIAVVRAKGSLLAWRRDAEAGPMALRITKQGLKAVDIEDEAVATPKETGGRTAPADKVKAPGRARNDQVNRKVDSRTPAFGSKTDSADLPLQRKCGREGKRQLLGEIVGSQHDRSLSLDWPFEELTRCSLLNRIAQPQKLIYSLICLHIMFAFKIVHRGGADRAPHRLALIKHREINDHSIEVVAQYFTSLQRHCKSSVEPHVPSSVASECTARPGPHGDHIIASRSPSDGVAES